MQKITPFLWFDGKAEEALEFYTSVFENSRVIGVMRYGDAGPGPKEAVTSRDVRASWPAIHRRERRPALYVLADHIVFRELQDASGSG
jgi:hypothetical protein